MTQVIVLLVVTDQLMSDKRISGTVRAGFVAKSAVSLEIMPSSKSAGCGQLITVMKTDYSNESKSQILKKSVGSQCSKECALLCFQAKCDVAYFDSNENKCYFTKQNVPHLAVCNRVWLIEQLRENPTELTQDAHNFCVFCAMKGTDSNNRTLFYHFAKQKDVITFFSRSSDQKNEETSGITSTTKVSKSQRKSTRPMKVQRLMHTVMPEELKT
uniref:Apple domain-containing protein n=1 Tax=Setaria digitata TaxID=48799 RepID=A0A915PH13_9BILA